MYSSPMVVLARSSWLSVVPTATRIVPCAAADDAIPAATAAASKMRIMSYLRTSFVPLLQYPVRRFLPEKLSETWRWRPPVGVDGAHDIWIGFRLIERPQPRELGNRLPMVV